MTLLEKQIIQAIQKSRRMIDKPKNQIEKMAQIERILKGAK